MTEEQIARMSAPQGPIEWRRGPAALRDDRILIDPQRAEPYVPLTDAASEDLLWDLASLRRPTDALRFVRRHGMLRSHPDLCEADDFVGEPWAEWESTAFELTTIMRWYEAVRAASDHGDIASLAALESGFEMVVSATWGDTIRFPRNYTANERLIAKAGLAISAGLNAGLLRSTLAIWPADALGQGRPGEFMYSPTSPDLVELAYYQLAQLIVTRAPLNRCPECGRLFASRDKRQRFCSPLCSGRSRQRRYAARKDSRGSDEGGQERSET